MAERQRRIMDVSSDWYEIDHGYIGRGEYHRVTHRALYSASAAPNYERLHRIGGEIIKTRKLQGDVLLACQSNAAYDVDGLTLDRWLAHAAHQVRRYSKRFPLIRYKPIGEHRYQPALHRILPLMWIVVSHTSSAALQALAAAVPVIVTNKNFPAALLATTFEQIETPRLPSVEERRELFARLAAQQWTIEEMASGLCWRELHGNR